MALIITFIVSVLLTFVPHFITNQSLVKIYTQHPQVKKQILGTEAQKESQWLPRRLKIPKINVDAAIQYVGLTSNGAMDVPDNIVDVGWFKFGPHPGEKGVSIIDGHIDNKKGELGVFNNLNKLLQGDKIYVLSDRGVTTTFVVRKIHDYNPGYADEVFFSNDNGIHLNLVTCDGTWDKSKKSYTKRLVVFADIAS